MRKTVKRSITTLPPLIVFALLSIGCRVSSDKVQQSIPTHLSATPALPIVESTVTLTFQPSPTATSTRTPAPDMPTSTPTPTPSPTWTPVPTLSLEELKGNVIELFSTNGGCDFPCWWGVSPGDPLEMAFSISPFVGEAPRRYEDNYFYVISLDSLKSGDLHISYQSNSIGAIQGINVSLEYPSRLRDYIDAFEQQLSLHNLLERYGRPSEALFLIKPKSEPNSSIAYALFLVFEAQNFGVEYWGIVDEEDPVRVCSIDLRDYHLYQIRLYMQDLKPIIKERNRFFLSTFRPLDQVTSMSLEDFYQAFSDSEYSGCIETLYDLWR